MGSPTGAGRARGPVALCLALLAALLLAAWPRTAEAIPYNLPAGFTWDDVAKNLGLVTDFLFLPDERMLVSTKNGRILVVKANLVSNIAADLSKLVGTAFGDRGLVRMVHHPDFGKGNGKDFIYIAYVYDPSAAEADLWFGGLKADLGENLAAPAGPKMDRLSRFRMEGDTIVADSEEILIGNCQFRQGRWWGDDCSPMIGTTHSINWMDFGPDGQLWVSVGDGNTFEGGYWLTKSGGPEQRWLGPMDPDFLPGKIWRIDENGNGLPDNPWYNGNPTAARSRVWALGIRQPWRCTFVPRTNPPELLCGVVGWYTFESLQRIKRASNLGWPCYEGPERTPVHIPSRIKRGMPADHEQRIPDHLADDAGFERHHHHSKRAENQATPDWDPSVCDGYYAGAKTGYVGITDEVAQADPLNDNVYAWLHEGQSSAIIGGPFTPSSWGQHADCVVVGDFVQNSVRCVKWDFANNRPAGWNPATGWKSVNALGLLEGSGDVVGFRIGPDGNLWIIGHCIDCNGYGVLRRLIPPGGNTSFPYGVDRAREEIAAAQNGGGSTGLPTFLSGDQCYPQDGSRVVLPALPQGWDAIMYAQSFAGQRIFARNGYEAGRGNSFGPVEIDSSVGGPDKLDGSTLSVSGIWFPRGFGTKSNSEIHLRIDGFCYRFTSSVGIDDAAGVRYITAVSKRKALGEFVVKADGRTVRNYTEIPAGQPATVVDVSELQDVTDLGLYGWRPQGNTMAMNTSISFLDWADPKLYCGPDAPYMPVVRITFPTRKNAFGVDENVVFEGSVSDYKGDPLPASSYSWYINLIHCQGARCHTHFFADFNGIVRGSFQTLAHPLDSQDQYYYYQIRLVGTDQCGRQDWDTVSVVLPSTYGPAGLNGLSICGRINCTSTDPPTDEDRRKKLF
ncbi:Sorbosone dehydrogenase-domain-containing protein [Hyaloraphidium curvatum]|nr:Sorbosone dehydrogenase-domain-containing protein [Hyaloraphidium curvatum]